MARRRWHPLPAPRSTLSPRPPLLTFTLLYVLKSHFHSEYKQLGKLLREPSSNEFPFISLHCRGSGEDLPDLGTPLLAKPQRWGLPGVPGASSPASLKGERGDFNHLPRESASHPPRGVSVLFR